MWHISTKTLIGRGWVGRDESKKDLLFILLYWRQKDSPPSLFVTPSSFNIFTKAWFQCENGMQPGGQAVSANLPPRVTGGQTRPDLLPGSAARACGTSPAVITTLGGQLEVAKCGPTSLQDWEHPPRSQCPGARTHSRVFHRGDRDWTTVTVLVIGVSYCLKYKRFRLYTLETGTLLASVVQTQ